MYLTKYIKMASGVSKTILIKYNYSGYLFNHILCHLSIFTYVEEKDLLLFVRCLAFWKSSIITELISNESTNCHIKIMTLVLGSAIKFNVCFSVSVNNDKISLVTI